MTDASLSEDEINALLRNERDPEEPEEKSDEEFAEHIQEADRSCSLSQDEIDAMLSADDDDVDLADLKIDMPEIHNPTKDVDMKNLADVKMDVTIELGRATHTLEEILHFGEGSIITLDKMAGEPVDLLVNGKKIAKGEVVVIDENFGIRLTEILNPED